jgi:hypothetical protein
MTTLAATRSILARAALPLALAVAVAAAACKENPAGTECDNARTQLNRPTDGKMLAFALAPQSIYYHYREIQPADTTIIDWDTTQAYFGVACLRFRTTDSVRIDPAGPFQLITSGSNGGTAWRQSHGQTDSVVAYTIWGCAGDGGTYRLQSDSTISFTWSNGQQNRFFGPAGVHRLRGDSLIETTATESYRADSTHADWRVNWVRADCGEGY